MAKYWFTQFPILARFNQYLTNTNQCILKTKNIFSWYSIFCNFFSSRFKGSDETEIITTFRFGLHILAKVIFGITQKPFCIKWSKLAKFVHKKGVSAKEKIKLPFERFFHNPLSKYLISKRVSCMHWLFWDIYQD